MLIRSDLIRLPGRGDEALTVCACPESHSLVAVGTDAGCVLLYDERSKAHVLLEKVNDEAVPAVAFAGASTLLYSREERVYALELRGGTGGDSEVSRAPMNESINTDWKCCG